MIALKDVSYSTQLAESQVPILGDNFFRPRTELELEKVLYTIKSLQPELAIFAGAHRDVEPNVDVLLACPKMGDGKTPLYGRFKKEDVVLVEFPSVFTPLGLGVELYNRVYAAGETHDSQLLAAGVDPTEFRFQVGAMRSFLEQGSYGGCFTRGERRINFKRQGVDPNVSEKASEYLGGMVFAPFIRSSMKRGGDFNPYKQEDNLLLRLRALSPKTMPIRLHNTPWGGGWIETESEAFSAHFGEPMLKAIEGMDAAKLMGVVRRDKPDSNSLYPGHNYHALLVELMTPGTIRRDEQRLKYLRAMSLVDIDRSTMEHYILHTVDNADPAIVQGQANNLTGFLESLLEAKKHSTGLDGIQLR
jgi:hypothetical protein